MKVAHKAHPGGSGISDGDDPTVDPFNNPNIIQDLIDKFALLGESGHHILIHLKKENCQEVEALKVQGDLQAEINCLQGKVVEAEHLIKEKAAKNENLQGVLQKEELISIGLKVALALEEEKKKVAEIKVAELEVKMSKSILEATTQAMEEFKASSEMKDLNIAFSQEAFIKGFKLYEGRVV
ncbi:hypothetical protein COCNU_01G014770 [Cocos nucifera]|uniref:Uncharacterized protein n=1 Tax=Cocos nucifera TaxID=13894 RepID=A0A8K0HWN5_COCNU|nr:hypothetical protein COCNU_01G014770 [Cocos nucifera]